MAGRHKGWHSDHVSGALEIQPERYDSPGHSEESGSGNDLEGDLVVGGTSLESIEDDLLEEPVGGGTGWTIGKDDRSIVEPGFDLQVGEVACCHHESENASLTETMVRHAAKREVDLSVPVRCKLSGIC